MDAIGCRDVVREFVRLVPGAREALQAVEEPDRRYFAEWPSVDSNLSDFLSIVLHPILFSALSGEEESDDVLNGCFDFIEGFFLNEDPHVQDVIYWEILDQFLRSREVLIKAHERCRPATKAALMRMLTEDYPGIFRNINWFPVE
ncbi:hypothetical protein [Streptomyces sp. 8N616]|uniref:hypothetical protein n=1 Tax=Streptomyces sp. 8N616 TaxID=3457414 RepID=UPI003FCF403C